MRNKQQICEKSVVDIASVDHFVHIFAFIVIFPVKKTRGFLTFLEVIEMLQNTRNH